MRKMSIRSRLLRMTFIATAIGLLLNAIVIDNAALPFAIAVTAATLAYEIAYHMAIRMKLRIERGRAPMSI